MDVVSILIRDFGRAQTGGIVMHLRLGDALFEELGLRAEVVEQLGGVLPVLKKLVRYTETRLLVETARK